MIKSSFRKMKTQSMSNDTFRKGKSLFVTLPFPLLDYLSSDYALSRSRRYSKIEAFRFLVQQCCHNPNGEFDGSHSMPNFSKLTKEWIWNRTTVSRFISVLCSMGVVEIQKVGTEKFVSLKPSVLQWIDCSDIEAERHRDDSLQPQATPSQSSSSERSETLSSGEKSLDN